VREFEKAICGMNHTEIHESSRQEIYLPSRKSGKKLEDI
jgi:hypothetical protein